MFTYGLVQRDDDPEGKGRVLVSYASLPGKPRSQWARVLSRQAGEHGGDVVIPTAGSTVLVGWVEGQSPQPVVLGSVFTDTAPPPTHDSEGRNTLLVWRWRRLEIEVDRANGTLKIHDREGDTEILIEDGGRVTLRAAESLALETKGRLTIRARELDCLVEQELELKAGSLAIEAPGDVMLLSPGSVTIHGDTISLN